MELEGVQIINHRSVEEKKRREEFAKVLFEKEQRNGMTMIRALETVKHRHYFGPMMVEKGYADAVLIGLTHNYTDSIRPALQVIGKRLGGKKCL